jgi:hypothetical protein
LRMEFESSYRQGFLVRGEAGWAGKKSRGGGIAFFMTGVGSDTEQR